MNAADQTEPTRAPGVPEVTIGVWAFGVGGFLLASTPVAFALWAGALIFAVVSLAQRRARANVVLVVLGLVFGPGLFPMFILGGHFYTWLSG